KHTAVVGTTGGGKSTTVSGLVHSLSGQNNAVLVFDVEGEYTALNEPTDAAPMLAALGKRALEPKGIDSTRVFVLAGRDCANPSHGAIKRFRLSFSDMSVYVLAEILGLSEPQERRLHDAYDICRITMERLQ